jgi:hypothetical protein
MNRAAAIVITSITSFVVFIISFPLVMKLQFMKLGSATNAAVLAVERAA